MALKALVLYGYGINCENESKYAIEKSGGKADILHLNSVLDSPKILEGYNMLMIPGGFSFGDDLGSGKVFGNKMKFRLKDQLADFTKADKLILGICNGFQVMVKMGLLPVPDFRQRVSLTTNDSGRYEDRWVFLKANTQSPCVFTKGIENILVPVRHGEGKFIPKDKEIMDELKERQPDSLPVRGRERGARRIPLQPQRLGRQRGRHLRQDRARLRHDAAPGGVQHRRELPVLGKGHGKGGARPPALQERGFLFGKKGDLIAEPHVAGAATS